MIFWNYQQIYDFIDNLDQVTDEEFEEISSWIAKLEKKYAKYKDFAFYHTPQILVRDLHRYLDLEDGDVVFDPTCGHWALLHGLWNIANIKVKGIEITDELYNIANKILKKEYWADKVSITKWDTLEFDWENAEDYNVIVANPPFWMKCKYYDKKEGKYKGFIEVPIFEKMLRAIEKGNVKQVITIFPSNFLEKYDKRLGITQRLSKAWYTIDVIWPFDEAFDNTKIRVSIFNIEKIEKTDFKPNLEIQTEEDKQVAIQLIPNKAQKGKFLISIIEKLKKWEKLNKEEQRFLEEMSVKSANEVDRFFENILENTINFTIPKKKEEDTYSNSYNLRSWKIFEDKEKDLRIVDIKNLIEIIEFRRKWMNVNIPETISKVIINPDTPLKELIGEITYNILNKGKYKQRDRKSWDFKKISLEKYYNSLDFSRKIEFFVNLEDWNDIDKLIWSDIDIEEKLWREFVKALEKLEEYKTDKDLQLFVKNYTKVLNGDSVTNNTMEKYIEVLNSKYRDTINEIFGVKGGINLIKLRNSSRYSYQSNWTSSWIRIILDSDLVNKVLLWEDISKEEEKRKKAIRGLIKYIDRNISSLSQRRRISVDYSLDFYPVSNFSELLEALYWEEEANKKLLEFKAIENKEDKLAFNNAVLALYEKIGVKREALLKYLMYFFSWYSLDFNDIDEANLEKIINYLTNIKWDNLLIIEQNALNFVKNLSILEEQRQKLLTMIFYFLFELWNHGLEDEDKSSEIVTLKLIINYLKEIKDFDNLFNILLSDITKAHKVHIILREGYTINTSSYGYNEKKIKTLDDFDKFIYKTLMEIAELLGLEINWEEVFSLLLYVGGRLQKMPKDTLDERELKYRNIWNKYTLLKENVLDKKELQILSPQNFLHTLSIGYGLKDKEEEIDLENYMEDNLEFLKKLLVYQKDGFLRALKWIEKYNWYIIADDVWLGKTYVWAAMVLYYLEQTDKKIMIIAPKSVVEGGAWERALQDMWLSDKVIKERIVIRNNTSFMKGINEDDFWFILVDEAHVFRNKDTQRGYSLSQFNKYSLIQTEVEERIEYERKTPMLMLTATPINNSMEDIYNLISYFYGEITLGGSVKFKIENEYFWKEFTKFINKYDRKKIVKNFWNIELKGAKIKDEYPEINYLETEDYETPEFREKFIDFINKSFKQGIDIKKINALSFSQADIEQAAVKSIYDVIKIDFDKFNLQDIFIEVEENDEIIKRVKKWERSEKKDFTGEYSYKRGDIRISFWILLSDLGLDRIGWNSKIRSYEEILKITKEEVEQKFFNIIKTKWFLTYLYIKNYVWVENIDEKEIKDFVNIVDINLNEVKKFFESVFYKNVKELFKTKLISNILSYAYYPHDRYRHFFKNEEAIKVANEIINENRKEILKRIEEELENWTSEYNKSIYKEYVKLLKEDKEIDISEFRKYKIQTTYWFESLTSQYLIEKVQELPKYSIVKTTWWFFGELWASTSYKDYSKAEIMELIKDYLADEMKNIKKIATLLEKQISKYLTQKKQEGIFSWFLGALVLKRMDSSLKAVYQTLINIWEKGELMTDEEEKEMLSKYTKGQKPLTKEQRKKILDIANEFQDFFLKTEDPKHWLLKDLIAKEQDKQWLIFTSYTDTLRDIEQFLKKEFPNLNIETITGQESKAVKQSKIYRFSPEVNGYKMKPEDKKIDILISTDTLSEWVNLHDVYRGINYDLPYNPVRLQQRVWRLFRIWAKHTPIFYNFVPSSLMDEMLGLMDIIWKKEQIIDSFFGIKRDNMSKIETETLIKTKRKEKKLDYNELMEEERKSDIFLEDIPEDEEENWNSIENLITQKVKEIWEENIELKDFNILFKKKEDPDNPYLEVKIIPFYYDQIVKEIKVEFLWEKEPRKFLGEDYYWEFLPKTLENLNNEFIGIEKWEEYFMFMKTLLVELQDYLKLEEKWIKSNFKKAYAKQYDLLTMINNPISHKKFSNEGEKLKFLLIIEK